MVNDIRVFVVDKEKGLFHDGKRVSNYIEVIALSRDTSSSRWKKRVLFKNMDGNELSIDIERKTLCTPKEIIEILFENGFDTSCNRQKLITYLTSAKPKKKNH
ncbi:MAG: hypothetical protein LBC04_01565 [Holosporaceae bacterium]|jgi:hypothetical protein|nr:hypothetical protein [Holosporaceae bacterium]